MWSPGVVTTAALLEIARGALEEGDGRVGIAAERELAFIQREAYIVQEGRGYGLGRSREIPFALAPGAPPLAPDASNKKRSCAPLPSSGESTPAATASTSPSLVRGTARASTPARDPLSAAVAGDAAIGMDFGSPQRSRRAARAPGGPRLQSANSKPSIMRRRARSDSAPLRQRPTRPRSPPTMISTGDLKKGVTIELDNESEVPGIDAKAFQEQAEATKKGCPVSKALAGTVQVLRDEDVQDLLDRSVIVPRVKRPNPPIPIRRLK